MAETTKTEKTKKQKKELDTMELTLKHSNGKEIKITGSWNGLEINSVKRPIKQISDQKIEVIP